MSKIKIEIPDGSPSKQIKMMRDWIEIIKSFEKLTGEEGKTDFAPIKKQIARLEKIK